MTGPVKNQVALQLEALETRDVPSVSSLWFSGSNLVVQTDDFSTTVAVRQSGSDIQIVEGRSGRMWSYAAAQVGLVEFRGGAGQDRFENNVPSLNIRAFGGAGDDTLVGSGGSDQIWGEAGNDVLLGMAGNDSLMGGDGDDQLNGREGIDSLYGGNGDDVLVAIDGGTRDSSQGNSGADILWVDRIGLIYERSTGNTTADRVNYVAAFANGADRSLDGDRIDDPTSIAGRSYERFNGNPLFSSLGPKTTDVAQGAAGDCWLLAGLGAIAMDRPHAIRQNVVDFNDGTYGVRLGNKFFRVDDDLPALPVTSGNYVFRPRPKPAAAKLGAEDSMWVAIVEKAYVQYRSKANSYSSLAGGWSIEVNRAFRTPAPGDRAFWTYASANALANEIYARWNTKQAVTVGITGAKPSFSGSYPVPMNHMYSVYSVERTAAGAVTGIVLRNPWGYDGVTTDADPSDGLVRVTPQQLFNLIGRVNWGRV